MKGDESAEVKLPNSMGSVKKLHTLVARFCRQQAIHPDIEFKIDLALEEIFTNIVRHGYDDCQGHEITIRLKSSRDRVRIQVEDDGRPFDPSRAPAVDLGARLEQRRIGGLGIHLVRRLMDQVRYQRRPQGNRLILIKCLAGKEKRT